MRNRVGITGLVILLGCGVAAGQEPKTEPAKKPVLSQTARLQAAKTAYIHNVGGGSEIPLNVIQSGIEGWGRLTLVDDPAKADLILEVSSPSEGSGVSISSTTKPSSTGSGRDETSTTTTRNLSTAPVKLTVIDAKSKTMLWSAQEPTKFGLKQKAREDNLVEAGQRLLRQLRSRVEPDTAQ